MPTIITQEQYQKQTQILWEKCTELQKKYPEDLRLKKMGRNIKRISKAYGAHKNFASKYLNIFEKYRHFFREERGALIVKCIELLQKLILHKKLNRED